MKYLITTCLLVLTATLLLGQPATAGSVCEDDDCSEAVKSIKLEAPVDPGATGYTSDRTAAFKSAYLAFKRIKEGHLADASWRGKYQRFELGGSNCLRYYDLESRFAYEYEKNPDFKTFIDQEERDITGFQKSGFDSSRRGINLSTRFKRDCPQKLREAEKDGLSDDEETKRIYDKLGQVQGYWDEKGNTLKQLEPIPEKTEEDTPQRRMSKKEQVEALTRQVAALPLGQETTDKLNTLTQDLNDLAPQASKLTDQLGGITDQLQDLLPQPNGLLDKIGNLLGMQQPLSEYVPKIPGTGIVDKIKDFFGRGKKLREKAAAMQEKVKNLQDQLGDTVEEAKQKGQEIADQGKGARQLLDQLKDLQEQQQALRDKLADKPRRILDELTEAAKAAEQRSEELLDQLKQGTNDLGKLRQELKDLEDKKKALDERIRQTKEDLQQIEKDEEALEQAGQDLQDEVDQLKKQEELKEQVADLEPTTAYAQQAAACEEELRELLDKLAGVEQKKEKARSGLGKLLSFPGKLLGKVTGFIEKHSGLKAILSALPGVGNLVNLVDGLFGKSKLIAGALELITGKQSKLMDTINGISQKVETVKNKVQGRVDQVTKVKDQITGFAQEKTDLLDVLGKQIDDLNPVQQQVIDLVRKHKLLGENSACNDLNQEETEVEELEEEIDEVEAQITEIEDELTDLEQQTTEIEEATEEVENQVAEVVEQEEEVAAEEEAIKEEFGQDMELEPVTVEEWSESFEVVRPYWEATFHPDDEVVEGYQGRYFQVQLKDADKTIKLLFGPGEYHMSKTDFRDNYGSVIGAFVTEALAAIRKRDRDGVKLFVQGSADISGATTFRGNLDESYYYDKLSLLPMKGSENFSGQETSTSIPARGFTNEHLPNLRGQFMKEMISVYSKKLQPILLEGSVKKEVDKEDRNAVIYLFLPATLLDLD